MKKKANNKKKGANDTKEFDREREFAVILEKIYSEIKAIGEGHATLEDKLDATMGMVANNREDITMLKMQNFSIKDEIVKINGKLAKIGQDIKVIKTDFGKRLLALESSHK